MTVQFVYAAFAVEYPEVARHELDRRPLERGLRSAFAEMVRGVTIADPGRRTARRRPARPLRPVGAEGGL